MAFGNLLSGLKNSLFESDGSQPAAEAPQGAPQQQQAPAQTPRPATTVGSGMSFSAPTAVNQEMVAAIRKQTMGRNTALTALMNAADQLADVIPDPTMRLKAAQKTAGAGRAAKEFADAVTIHLADVDAAEMSFGQALEGKIKSEVGGLKAQAGQAEAAVNAANNEIQSLQQRIATLQQQTIEQTTALHNFNAQAASKEAELRQAEVEFKAAAAHVRNELNGHKATILSTLG